MLFILFGLPGVGKTYAGRIFQKHFGYELYEGDRDIPKEMKQALEANEIVTDEMRDKFFAKLIANVEDMSKKHSKLVITQTFLKEKYRKQLLKNINNARFVLIRADDNIREKRLSKRKEFPLDLTYARQMSANFEVPQIPHDVIDNTVNGEENLKKQIAKLLEKRLP